MPNIGNTMPIYKVNISETSTGEDQQVKIEQIDEKKIQKLLMQRYNIVSKIRDSEKTQVIGILVGSVVVPKYK